MTSTQELRYMDTADRLLGIDDDWTVADIREHLNWLVDNPDEICDGYDKEVMVYENIEEIMFWVKALSDKT